jgi:hypothetical protein
VVVTKGEEGAERKTLVKGKADQNQFECREKTGQVCISLYFEVN